MRGKPFFWGLLRSSVVLSCLLLMWLAFGCKEKTEQTGSQERTREVAGEQVTKEAGIEEQPGQLVFDLDEVSVFDLSSDISRDFVRGQLTLCYDQPDKVRPGQYPHFKSARPIHGMINFAGKTVGQSPPRMYYHLAIDESAGTGTGYDRLYFDRNGDGDLADERPLMPLKDPPKAALMQYSSTEQQVCFESLEVTFDFGSAGTHPVEIMARLIARQQDPQLTFFATKVRKGEIKIGDAKHDAVLGHSYVFGTPFDRPGTTFHLIPKSDPQNPPRWWGSDQLNSIHAIGGAYYRFATTALGDKLFARPYEGELGTFEVGPGGRDIQEVSIQGSLRSENTAVAVGDGMERGWPKPTKSCRVPVGDYLPAYLRLTFGRLSIFISENYHTDGRPSSRGSRSYVYGIKIRQNRPYIFDLSNKPDVLFATPAKDQRIKLGDQLQVKAVLIDPGLDIMIRGLDDTSRKEKKEFTTPDGQKHSFERNVSLDPKVVITRADGQQVAEGVMPFG
jgi:hypothetical protein